MTRQERLNEAIDNFLSHTATPPFELEIDPIWDEHYEMYWSNLNNAWQDWKENQEQDKEDRYNLAVKTLMEWKANN